MNKAKFILCGGKITFLPYRVTWEAEEETQMEDCTAAGKEIILKTFPEAVVEELELPEYPGDISTKTFSAYNDAVAFLEGTLPKTQIEVLQETVDALVIAALEV